MPRNTAALAPLPEAGAGRSPSAPEPPGRRGGLAAGGFLAALRGPGEARSGWLIPFLRVLGLLLLLALLSGVANYVRFIPPEGARGAMRVRWPLWRGFVMSLGGWAALVPSFLLLAPWIRRTPLGRSRWRRLLLRHAAGAGLYVPLQYGLSLAVYAALCTLLGSWRETREILSQIPPGAHGAGLIETLFHYFATAAFLYAWYALERERVKRRQLAQARLRMLRMQLNPHFLFNTLNAVVSLMRRDVDQAERMTLALTDFLRTTLEEDGALESPFGRELETARRYHEIEAIRFPGRIALEVEVEPRLREALVPSLLLQPLVENAVRHGLAPLASGGKVRVSAWAGEGRFHLRVEDDGAGAKAGGAPGTGVGLANLRDRLAHLYGEEARLEAGPRPEGGFRVAMAFPLAFPGGRERRP